jgi:hypothetical protein
MDHATPTSAPGPVDLSARLNVFARAVWLLPAFSALTLWATLEHQPDPSTEFTKWSEFVTTDRFLLQHVIGSIGGQALFALGAAALGGVLVLRSARPRQAAWGVAAGIIGSGGLLAGFGTAAFAQPAIGNLELGGYAGGKDVYDDVYTPLAIGVLLGGALLFAVSTVLLARSASTLDSVSRWGVWLFGASGPLVGVFGIFIGELQTVGAVAGVVGGVMMARAAIQR